MGERGIPPPRGSDKYAVINNKQMEVQMQKQKAGKAPKKKYRQQPNPPLSPLPPENSQGSAPFDAWKQSSQGTRGKTKIPRKVWVLWKTFGLSAFLPCFYLARIFLAKVARQPPPPLPVTGPMLTPGGFSTRLLLRTPLHVRSLKHPVA